MSKVYPKFKHFDVVWLKKGYHGKNFKILEHGEKCTNVTFLKFSKPVFSSGNEMSRKLSKWYFTVTHKVTWLKKLLIKGHT